MEIAPTVNPPLLLIAVLFLHLQYFGEQEGMIGKEKNKTLTPDDIKKMLKISKDVDPVERLIELAPTLSPNNSCFDTAYFLFELFATRLPNSQKIQNLNENLNYQLFLKIMGKYKNFVKSCLIQIQIQAYGDSIHNHYITFYRQTIDKPFTLYHSWIDSISLQTWCKNLGSIRNEVKENIFNNPREYIMQWLEYWMMLNKDMDGLSLAQVKQMWLFMSKLNEILIVRSVFYRWPK